MTGALIILAATVLTGLVLWMLHKPEPAAPPSEDSVQESGDDNAECCGLHAVCEKKSRMAEAPVYFDDEELDRFAGRSGSDYTDDETEEFREVLYTLLPDDIESWGFSLQARGVEMPLPIRDEWVMLASENKRNDGTAQI